MFDIHIITKELTHILQQRSGSSMSFILKILFAAIIFVLVGGTTLLALRDVTITQEQITKTIPQDQYLDD